MESVGRTQKVQGKEIQVPVPETGRDKELLLMIEWIFSTTLALRGTVLEGETNKFYLSVFYHQFHSELGVSGPEYKAFLLQG